MGKLLFTRTHIAAPELSGIKAGTATEPATRMAIKTQDDAGRYIFVPEPPPEPTMAELASNFGQAVAKWADAGLPVVSGEVYDERSAACTGCELWDATARLGLGKCNAPGCGCTKLKRWLATEQCKHPAGSRWPAVP